MDLNNIKVKRIFNDPDYITRAFAELETGETIIFYGCPDNSYKIKKWEYNISIFRVTAKDAHFATAVLPTKEDYDKFPYKEYIKVYNKKFGCYKIKPKVISKVVKAIKEYCDKPNNSDTKLIFADYPELYKNDVYNKDDYNDYPDFEDVKLEIRARLMENNAESNKNDETEAENTNENQNSSYHEKTNVNELSDERSISSSRTSEEEYSCKEQGKDAVIFR